MTLAPPASLFTAPTATPAPQAATQPSWREVARIWVPGIPRPGGSKTARVIMRMGKVVMTSSGRPLVTMRDDAVGNKEWKQTVAAHGKIDYRGEPLDGVLAVDFLFYLPRPKFHYRTGKHRGELKPGAPTFHTTRPDCTKLIRSTEDALSEIVWIDDARIAVQSGKKMYGDRIGAEVVVSVMEGGVW